jgi:hypothetical protein
VVVLNTQGVVESGFNFALIAFLTAHSYIINKAHHLDNPEYSLAHAMIAVSAELKIIFATGTLFQSLLAWLYFTNLRTCP